MDRVNAYIPDAIWYDYETVSEVAPCPRDLPLAEDSAKAAAVLGAWGRMMVGGFTIS